MCNRLLSVLCTLTICFSAFLPLSYAERLLDPTRPTSSKAAVSTGATKITDAWRLTSTLISNGRRNATINGKIVSIGEYINRAKVASIQPNEVWLIYKQKRIRIKLLARKIKDFSRSAAK